MSEVSECPFCGHPVTVEGGRIVHPWEKPVSKGQNDE